jgi:hypothetical protein
MHSSAALIHSLVLLFLIGLFVVPRFAAKPANSTGKKRFCLRFSGAFIGNALMPLHALIHPHTKHLIVQQLDNHAEEDQDSDSTDPAQHLQRQLNRIRSGEELDHITTLLR